MSWRIEFRPEVERDVAGAAAWYEEREPGLGAEFIEVSSGCGMRWPTTHCMAANAILPRISAGE